MKKRVGDMTFDEAFNICNENVCSNCPLYIKSAKICPLDTVNLCVDDVIDLPEKKGGIEK